jgi:hypothetical protein
MAASFIKKSDGNYYLRLTDNTDSVKFAAVSQAGNTYTFSVNGSVVVSKPNVDTGNLIYYTSSANPVPSGGNLDDGRFPGAETIYTYPGPGDYPLSFTSSGPGTQFYLGGASLTWGGYAYPGSGYISNPVAVGVKQSGTWSNAGNIFIKNGGSWKEVQTAWIKRNGSWTKVFQNYGNSSWINMLEGTDDAIDFGVQVIALSELTIIISTTTTNLNLKSRFDTTFGAGSWESNTPKKVIINSGIIIGATSTANYALNIPSGLGGTLRIDNNGSIRGAGGAANSGTGGNTIFAGSAVSINNLGTIYAGGGGGGQGGTGGGGFYTYPATYYYGGANGDYHNFDDLCAAFFGGGAYCAGGEYAVFDELGNSYLYCGDCRKNYTATAYTSGGAGGNGGVGRGYNQTQAGGLGGAAGGTNAGTGGTGGTGGNWGTGGGNGFVGSNGNASAAPTLGQSGGPAYGGLAGYYIVNNGNVTWIATGTRLGRVG